MQPGRRLAILFVLASSSCSRSVLATRCPGGLVVLAGPNPITAIAASGRPSQPGQELILLLQMYVELY